MPSRIRLLAWVSFITFSLEGVAILVGPNVYDGLEALLDATGDHGVVVSQGAALLLIAASIYLSDVIFGAFQTSLDLAAETTRQPSDQQSRSSRWISSRLYAESPSGERTRLVVESASGEQLRLLVETEANTDVTEEREADQAPVVTQSELARLAVAAFGFLGSIYILAGENAFLVAFVLTPPVYALLVSGTSLAVYRFFHRRRG